MSMMSMSSDDLIQLAGAAAKGIRSFQDSDYDLVRTWTSQLGDFYNGHEDQSQNLLDQLIGAAERDANGLHTRRKHLFTFEHDSRPVVAFCLNYKRGGSVKLGPLLSSPRKSIFHLRLMIEAMSGVLAIVQAARARKMYGTSSSLNDGMQRLLTEALPAPLRPKVEAVFPRHFHATADEMIIGRHIVPPTKSPICALRSLMRADATPHEITIRYLEPSDRPYLVEVVDLYSQWQDDLGGEYVDSLLNAHERGRLSGWSFQQRAGHIFVAEARGKRVGIAALLPKRGGPGKLYPLSGAPAAQRELINHIAARADSFGIHKLYTMVSEHDHDQSQLLNDLGFQRRGLLESPYKSGHDLIPMDRMLSHSSP